MTMAPLNAASDAEAQDARWSDLMARAQEGDGRAYAVLLHECRPLLRRICATRLRDPAETEDAVQDALLTLHLIRHTYDPARPFRPWLAAIAERRAIDRSRRRTRRTRHETAFAAEPGREAATMPGGHDILASNHLRAALSTLPQSQRVALGLTKLEELSLADASARSGMSVGALKVATHRAFLALRRRLGGRA